MVEKLIVDDFYYFAYSVSNIIINGVISRKSATNKIYFTVIILLIIPSASMTNHRHNKPVVIPYVIEFILPIKLICR
jgi:hypothetical protein